MHTIKDIDTLLKSHGNPSPSLLMPIILNASEQEVRTEAADRMTGMMATKQHPDRGIRHLLRTLKRVDQSSSLKVTCMLAMLQQDRLDWLGMVQQAWSYLDARERLEVLTHVKPKRQELLAQFLEEVFGTREDTGNAALDGLVADTAHGLLEGIDYDGLFPDQGDIEIEYVDYLESLPPITMDPFGYGAPLPEQAEVFEDPTYGWYADHDDPKMLQIFDSREPLGEDNPLVLVDAGNYMSYDGNTLRYINFETLPDVDELMMEPDEDLYIRPLEYIEDVEFAENSRESLLENPGLLGLFCSELMGGVEDIDLVLDLLEQLDPGLMPAIDAVRKEVNVLERGYIAYTNRTNGMHDTWHDSVEFFVDDDGKAYVRMIEAWGEDIAMILRGEADTTNWGGKILPKDQWVTIGDEVQVGAVGQLHEAVRGIVEEFDHMMLEPQEVIDGLDTSQIELVFGLLVDMNDRDGV